MRKRGYTLTHELTTTNIELKNKAVFVVNGMDKLKTDVERLVNEMKTVTVTEDTIQTNKKLLSTIRAQFDAIDRERKDLKAKLLVDYEVLSGELKDVENILSEGENHIRQQVRKFEAEQLAQRTADVQELYNHYAQSYRAPSWLSFSDFYIRNKRVTNKSVSKKFIRESIITWFEGYKEAVDAFNSYSDSDITRKALIALYREQGFDIDNAIEAYERQQRFMKEAEERKKLRVVTNVDKHQKLEDEVVWKQISVKSTDFVKAIQVLKQNGIEVSIN